MKYSPVKEKFANTNEWVSNGKVSVQETFCQRHVLGSLAKVRELNSKWQFKKNVYVYSFFPVTYMLEDLEKKIIHSINKHTHNKPEY